MPREFDMHRHSESFVQTVLIAMQVVISGTYLMSKVALQEFSPLALAMARLITAGSFFAVLLAARRRPWPARRDWPWVLAAAALGVAINQGLFLTGMKYALASHGALFYAATPAMVLALSVLLRQEKITLLRSAGITLGFAGVVLVLLDRGLSFSREALWGDLLLVAAVLSWSGYTILCKKLTSRLPAWQLTALAMTLGTVLFLPAGLPALLAQDLAGLSYKGIAAMLYLALLTSVAGYLVWNWGLARLDASRVAIMSNLQPVMASILAWLVLEEPITVQFVLGAAVIMSGVYLAQRRPRPEIKH